MQASQHATQTARQGENARVREQGLSFLSLTSLVIASMIGAGVFTTSGLALGDLGTPGRVLLAWLVGGGVALCGALSYGALARRMTESGGEYLFLSRVIHPLAGFLAGWVSLLAGFTGAIAFAATAFAAYALPDNLRPSWLPHDVLATVVVVGVGIVHGRHIQGGALSQNVTVCVKLGLIAVFLLYALLKLPAPLWQGGPVIAPDTSAPPPFSLSAFAVTVMWISLSYSGFNAAIYVAGEAREAETTVPRAMVAGTILVTVLYLALNAVFVYAPAPEMIVQQQDVAARAAFALGGEPLALAIRVIIALALLTSVSAMVMTGPRVYARMAEDGVFPALFRMRSGAPGAAVTLQVLLAVIVIWLAELQELLSYLGFTLSISAAATVASLFVLRRREGAQRVPIPGYPFVPSLFVLSTLSFAGLAAVRRPVEPLAGVTTIALGVMLYWLTSWRRRTQNAEVDE
jgi:APA family basic amino acid/polyamine antiporter